MDQVIFSLFLFASHPHTHTHPLPPVEERPMYSQMTGRQVASKEVIKAWIDLYIRLFRSRDIYWNLCFTPAVREALCLLSLTANLSKPHVDHLAPEHIKEHHPSSWLSVGLSSSSPIRPRGLRAQIQWESLQPSFFYAKDESHRSSEERLSTGTGGKPGLWDSN